jgi:hypothetical protein
VKNVIYRLPCIAVAMTAAVPLLATPAPAAPMSRIVEAGITCDGSNAPDNLGPRFYKYVGSICRGRDSCRVQATAVASLRQLRSYRCTDFFVIFQCRGKNQEARSVGLADTLAVTCR